MPSETCTRRREGSHKTRRLQQAFADHLKDVARAYPAMKHERVVLVIDNAPWHQGAVVTEMLARHRHLELYRSPSYSPELNPIERLWKLLRHRVTHNRLFETLSVVLRADQIRQAIPACGMAGESPRRCPEYQGAYLQSRYSAEAMAEHSIPRCSNHFRQVATFMADDLA